MSIRERLSLLDPFGLVDEDIDLLREAFATDDAAMQIDAIDALEEVTDERALAALLDLVQRRDASVEVRAKAAVAFGPALEIYDYDRDEPLFGDEEIDPAVAKQTQRTLIAIVRDESEPKLVRRRALEASIRSYEDEHAPLIRRFWIDRDVEWRMTAVFCMGYAPGFEREILGAVRRPRARGPSSRRGDAKRGTSRHASGAKSSLRRGRGSNRTGRLAPRRARSGGRAGASTGGADPARGGDARQGEAPRAREITAR